MSHDCLQLFKHVLQTLPEVQVVWISTWRNRPEDIYRAAGEALPGCGIFLKERTAGSISMPGVDNAPQGILIDMFRYANGGSGTDMPYAIVTDDTLGIHQQYRLVTTNHESGLTVQDAIRIMAMFGVKGEYISKRKES
jgi:hypothetical protein